MTEVFAVFDPAFHELNHADPHPVPDGSQGQAERLHRTSSMVGAMDAAGFGNCSNHYECQAVCPKGVSVKFIAKLNREYQKSLFK